MCNEHTSPDGVTSGISSYHFVSLLLVQKIITVGDDDHDLPYFCWLLLSTVHLIQTTLSLPFSSSLFFMLIIYFNRDLHTFESLVIFSHHDVFLLIFTFCVTCGEKERERERSSFNLLEVIRFDQKVMKTLGFRIFHLFLREFRSSCVTLLRRGEKRS